MRRDLFIVTTRCAIELCKSRQLHKGFGFNDITSISDEAYNDLLWIFSNVAKYNCKPIIEPKIDLYIESDASLFGWGASFNGQNIGGRWTRDEGENHINYLELLAAFFGLRSFAGCKRSVHIRVKMDNTTAIAYINNGGGVSGLMV